MNAALTDMLATCPQAVVLGEDVGVKGGVYGVTLGPAEDLRVGAGLRHPARRADGPRDSRSARRWPGCCPIAEIQYLAYLHNAEDQLRGEAATLGFFSDGQYTNGMVVRIASLASLKGFGGHFHNDNAIGVLRDIPGIVVGCASGPAEAPELLRTLAGLALGEGRVGVLLEPTALYHDKGETAPYAAPEEWRKEGQSERDLGRTHWAGRDVLVVTFGNGVGLSRRAIERTGVAATSSTSGGSRRCQSCICSRLPRRSRGCWWSTRRGVPGGVSEGVVTALVEGGYGGSIARITAEDSFIPLGPAAAHVVLTEDDVVAALTGAAGS